MAEQKPVADSRNRVAIHGQISGVRAVEGRYYHSIVTPTDNPYTPPQVVEVRSDRRLGEPGSEFQAIGRLQGFERQFSLKNGGKGTAVTMWVEVE